MRWTRSSAIFFCSFYLTRKYLTERIYISEPVHDSTIHALQQLLSSKVKVIPERNNQMVEIAYNTARENLRSKIRQEKFHTTYLLQIQTLLKLPVIPKKIEVYDNSHNYGAHAVGVMIVVDKNGFNKKLYRKFNMSSHHNANDYSMMAEMIERRMKKDDTKPDVVFIDGGPGHVHIGQRFLRDIPFLCIAKGVNRNSGEEALYLADKTAIKLQKSDKLLFFLQRIRDESHRFAITSYRQKHNKKLTTSVLEEIDGVGQVIAKRLLYHFSSIKEIGRQSPKKLQTVPGVSERTANNIYNFFKT